MNEALAVVKYDVNEAARQAALRPDKEKLVAWADAFLAIPDPELSDEKAHDIWEDNLVDIQTIVGVIKQEAQNL